jgi:hypothetical protein
MPTERKPLHRAHRSRLADDEEMELWLGPSHRGSAFESETGRQWAWTQHRDRLMDIWGKHGKRPWAWWHYESGCAHPGNHQTSTLYEMGILSDEERAELLAEWRRQFERAWRPGFFHCEGPGAFFHGEIARRKHFAWADIPRALLKEWRSQRRRRPVVEPQAEGCPT